MNRYRIVAAFLFFLTATGCAAQSRTDTAKASGNPEEQISAEPEMSREEIMNLAARVYISGGTNDRERYAVAVGTLAADYCGIPTIMPMISSGKFDEKVLAEEWDKSSAADFIKWEEFMKKTEKVFNRGPKKEDFEMINSVLPRVLEDKNHAADDEKAAREYFGLSPMSKSNS